MRILLLVYLHLFVHFVELVLEDFPMTHVLELIDQGAVLLLLGLVLRLIIELDDVKSVRAVLVDRGGHADGVVGPFLHWVDIGVDVEFDLQLPDVSDTLDPRH